MLFKKLYINIKIWQAASFINPLTIHTAIIIIKTYTTQNYGLSYYVLVII